MAYIYLLYGTSANATICSTSCYIHSVIRVQYWFGNELIRASFVEETRTSIISQTCWLCNQVYSRSEGADAWVNATLARRLRKSASHLGRTVRVRFSGRLWFRPAPTSEDLREGPRSTPHRLQAPSNKSQNKIYLVCSLHIMR